MQRSRRNDFGADHRAGRLDIGSYASAGSGYVVDCEPDVDRERWNVDPYLVGDERGRVRCIRCVVRFESCQRNCQRGSAECEREFLARVYRSRWYEFCDSNRPGAAGRSGTDPVICRFAVECDQRWHLHTELEYHGSDELHRKWGLDGCSSGLGYDNGRAADDRSDVYLGLHRRRWHGDTLGDHHDCSAEHPNADVNGITVECGERHELDIDVEYDQRDELYRVGSVDRD